MKNRKKKHGSFVPLGRLLFGNDFFGGLGAVFSKIRNLSNSQSCLYNCLYNEIDRLSINYKTLYYTKPVGGIEPLTY